MRHQTPRKTLGHEANRSKQKKSVPTAQSNVSPLPFDVEHWKLFWQQETAAGLQIKEPRKALKTQPQEKEALAALRLAVSEKFNILGEMYVYQCGSRPDEGDPNSWWSIARAYELLRGGDVSELETVIRFIENDPWFHGSGYLKENVIPAIKPWMLSQENVQRLQSVCLSLVDKRDGREFRAYCRLAHKVDAPEFRQALTQRLRHADSNVRRRARWVLDALQQPR